MTIRQLTDKIKWFDINKRCHNENIKFYCSNQLKKMILFILDIIKCVIMEFVTWDATAYIIFSLIWVVLSNHLLRKTALLMSSFFGEISIWELANNVKRIMMHALICLSDISPESGFFQSTDIQTQLELCHFL